MASLPLRVVLLLSAARPDSKLCHKNEPGDDRIEEGA
jgi:hypothetical protein